MANDTITVACTHCRTILTLPSISKSQKFRCATCREVTPRTVGITLARNLEADHEREYRSEQSRRWLPLKIIGGIVGVLGLLAGGGLLTRGCSNPQTVQPTQTSLTFTVTPMPGH